MLGHWSLHEEYQSYLLEKFYRFLKLTRITVVQYKKALSKLYIFNLDSLKPLLAPYYSITGAPAKYQPELIRSFILMSELRCQSITEWVKKLSHNEILCVMIGLSKSQIHEWLQNPDLEYQFNHSLHNFKKKAFQEAWEN